MRKGAKLDRVENIPFLQLASEETAVSDEPIRLTQMVEASG